MEDFIYTTSGTDITKRWRLLYNYVPASEQEEVRQRWAELRAKFNKTLDDIAQNDYK